MTFDNFDHPREPAGRFTDKPQSPPEITMTNHVTCPECGVSRARGVVHRCPAPKLLTLSTATRKVLAACRAAGGRPVIVGGSVRDALISRGTAVVPKDVDIEVYAVAGFDTLKNQIAPLGRVDLTGVSFGVLKATVDGEDFDVSIPRTDSKTGDGHRGFETTTDPDLDEVQAFARRDFTLNALGWDPLTEELIDPWGGAVDLRDGVLRHTTEAFSEDPLRVLRSVQFAARFGFDLAPETAELAREIAGTYPDLAVERVWQEWRKIATRGTHISKALDVLEDTGWMAHFPELAATSVTPQDPLWHPEGSVLVHLGLSADIAAANADSDGLSAEEREVIVLATLLHDIGKPGTTIIGERITSAGHAEHGVPVAREFLHRIGAPEAVIDKVLPLIDEHMCHASTNASPSTSAVRRLIRRLSAGPNAPTIYDWARVVAADSAGRGSGAKPDPSVAWLEVAERVGPEPKKSLLRGGHLISKGWQPNAAFKAVIAASVEAQDDGLFDTEAGAIAWFEVHGEQIRAATLIPVTETKKERTARLLAAQTGSSIAGSSASVG